MTSTRRRAVAAILVATLVASCGAGDRRAPRVEPPDGPCPAVGAFLPTLLGILRSERFTPVRRLIEEEVVAGGPQRRPVVPDLVRGVIEIARRLPLDDPDVGLDALEPLVPVLRRVLTVALSDAGACATPPDPACPRLGGLVALGHALARCGGAPPRAPDSAGGGSALMRGVEAAVRVIAELTAAGARSPLRDLEEILRHPRIRELLRTIVVEDLVGRDGVALLLRKLLEILADPLFEYAEVQDLMDTLVLPFVRTAFPELETPLERLVATGAHLLADGRVQASLAPFLACLHDVEYPADPALPHGQTAALLYDVVVAEELDHVDGLADLLGLLSDLLESRVAAVVAGSLTDVAGYLATADGPRDALLRVLGAALSPARAREVGDALLAVFGSAALSEVDALLAQMRTGCGAAERSR